MFRQSTNQNHYSVLKRRPGGTRKWPDISAMFSFSHRGYYTMKIGSHVAFQSVFAFKWYAAEICMPCKHILRFRDLLTRTARSVGSNKKFIPSMPRVPKSPVYRVCQIFLRALKAQVSSLNL